MVCAVVCELSLSSADMMGAGYLPDGLPACGGQAGWLLDI